MDFAATAPRACGIMRLRILVVEDEHKIAHSIKRGLEITIVDTNGALHIKMGIVIF